MAKSLIIVESPAKARTIKKYLGAGFTVKASIGHVKDLPEHRLGIDVAHDFAPEYVPIKGKKKLLQELRTEAEKAERVYLAPDPDREGEAIAWHIASELPRTPSDHIYRILLHEITKKGITEALQQPGRIDADKVSAQQARRLLDRLVGYKISPLLWQKVQRGLSAGRVQSVALRILCEREQEIQAFQSEEYWTIDATMAVDDPPPFQARLHAISGKKAQVTNEADARHIVADLHAAQYTVAEVKKTARRRHPAPPFATSTLQQEAARKLRFSAQRTMRVAQQLYEGLALGAEGEVGLITYMRTDSTNVAASAQQETRAYITERFGREFLPASARVFAKKVKGAQEAHEAIRPTHVRREPEAVRRYLNNDQNRLYNLIWQRMVASQMADALCDVTTVDIEGMPSAGQDPLLLRATNTQLQFAGFRQVYIEGRDDDTEEDLGNNPLPALSEADVLRALGFFPEQHFTEPPPRFTEATLIKALEENGIGRPSTYAPTMSTIQDRGYVEKDGRYLKPSDLGFVVNDLLVDHFQHFVHIGCTAGMEAELDDIASGDRRWQPVVEEFYRPLEKALTLAKETAPKQVETTDVQCPECGKPMLIRWGRRGRFLACSGFPECKGTLPLEGEQQEAPQQTDEQCPECSSPMVIKSGRFGRFLACSRYPECKGRKPFTVTTGVRCPRDAGELLERRSRRGRIFYGCSNYPKCDFTT